MLYAEFGTFTFDTIFSHEFYEMDADPWQMRNLYGAMPAAERGQWAHRVAQLFRCSGVACRMAQDELLFAHVL